MIIALSNKGLHITTKGHIEGIETLPDIIFLYERQNIWTDIKAVKPKDEVLQKLSQCCMIHKMGIYLSNLPLQRV